MSEINELTFEQALSKLEEVVTKLESGDVPLEKAIDLYQNGMHLTKLCDDKLKQAEEKMTQLLNDDDQLQPFELEEE